MGLSVRERKKKRIAENVLKREAVSSGELQTRFFKPRWNCTPGSSLKECYRHKFSISLEKVGKIFLSLTCKIQNGGKR